VKAIIIGAGIGGLATAIALKNAGIAVHVYERADGPRDVGAGLSLWPNAVHALNKLGLGDWLNINARPNMSAGLLSPSGKILAKMGEADLAERYGAETVVVHRGDFLRALTEAFGGHITYRRNLTRYEQNGDAIIAHFDDNTFDTGNVLIGADGIHSAVRAQMQPKANTVYSGYAAWRGVVAFPHKTVGTMWGEIWGRGNRFGVLPLDDERVYWFAVENRPQNTPPQDHRLHLLKTFGGWNEPIPSLIEQTLTEALLYNDIIDLDPLESWIDGRAVLLGDAAHAMTPNMGQGACQALEDAVVLGRTLAEADSVAEGLAVYQTERLPHTRKVQKQSRQFGQIGQLGNPLAVALRNAGMRITPPSMAANALDYVLRNRV
jgi:FAD-dependent urate hydroxylase